MAYLPASLAPAVGSHLLFSLQLLVTPGRVPGHPGTLTYSIRLPVAAGPSPGILCTDNEEQVAGAGPGHGS